MMGGTVTNLAGSTEPMIGGVVDDVSMIYPLETNECYFNYSPKNGVNNYNNNINGSNGKKTSAGFNNNDIH